MIVSTRGEALGLRHRLNVKEIARTSRLVSMVTGYPVQPNKAVVGANAFAHESGIHQHGVLMNRATYEIMDPVEVGYEGSKIVLGKHSGRHALAHRLKQLGYSLDAEDLTDAYHRFSELADRKKFIFDQDLLGLVPQRLRRPPATTRVSASTSRV